MLFCGICPNSYSQKGVEISPISVHSIDTRTCISKFTSYYIGPTNSHTTFSYLRNRLHNLNTPNISLLIVDSIKSKKSVHFRFIQTYNNILVYRGDVKINCTDKGYVTSYFDNTFSFTNVPSTNFPSNGIGDIFISTKHNTEVLKKELCYFPQSDQFIPALRIELLQNNNYNFETILDVSGNILYQRDLGAYYHTQAPIDSTVNALVFNPDPITTASVVYGTPYVDSTDIDLSVLNAERVSKNLRVQYSGDTFYLKNNFVTIKDFDSPVVAPAFMVGTPSFIYTRAQSGFEDVNAFYHINKMQEHIQALGFNNMVNYSIQVDPHAMNGADNSQFIPSSKRLYFGEGGVDDAEDADVIVHEYGHAMSHSAAPGTNSGNQRQALDEALGDYNASSYSRSINTYKWENAFSWDGHNQFWGGRKTLSTKTYPGSLIGNVYMDAEIWSATLMQIWGDIGRDTTDELLYESLSSYATNMTMADAAILYLQTDTILYNGAHYTPICNRFFNRGLFSSCIVSTNELPHKSSQFKINTLAFAEGRDLEIIFDQPETGNISVIDIQGKTLYTRSIYNTQSIFIDNKFSSGLYFITLRTEKNYYCTKLIRY